MSVLLSMSSLKDKELRRIYYDPSHTAAYSNARKLYAAVKHLDISKRYVEIWLKKQEVYTLHRPALKHFKRNKVTVFGQNSQWQADLVDVQVLSRWNKRFKYLLTCIDVFSKVAWVIPIKDKKGTTLVAAFKKIFRSNQKPIALQTDKGTEFTNRLLQKWLKSNGISYFTSNNETKCSLVERFNRTLKGKKFGSILRLTILQNISMYYHRSLIII